jgi:hypothetical protein
VKKAVFVLALGAASCGQKDDAQAANAATSLNAVAVAATSSEKSKPISLSNVRVTDADREQYEGFSDEEIRALKTDANGPTSLATECNGYYVAVDVGDPNSSEALRVSGADITNIVYERGGEHGIESYQIDDAYLMPSEDRPHFIDFKVQDQEMRFVCYPHHAEIERTPEGGGEDYSTYFFPSKKSLKQVIAEWNTENGSE